MTDPASPSISPQPDPHAADGRVTIKVRKNGSLLVTGNFELVNHEGVAIPRPTGKPNVALCRCGHSKNKPFCDGSHKTCGFVDPPDPPTAG
ncbi:MAG: CDGSH iron-sulfur domain-containing protein [Gemmatimonadaceae bacterium]|nr:CDGSH iron-sulfur domain-containing protein [Gemmatimonadaceae bacterium]